MSWKKLSRIPPAPQRGQKTKVLYAKDLAFSNTSNPQTWDTIPVCMFKHQQSIDTGLSYSMPFQAPVHRHVTQLQYAFSNTSNPQTWCSLPVCIFKHQQCIFKHQQSTDMGLSYSMHFQTPAVHRHRDRFQYAFSNTSSPQTWHLAR